MDLANFEEAIGDVSGIFYTYSKSRFPDMISDIWYGVTGSIKLPRKDPNPDSPLLRYVDAVLRHCIGNQRPDKASILNFISYYVKPQIIEDHEQEKMVNSVGGDFGL